MHNQEERRRRENADLLARYRAGEKLARIDATATWWPRHPPIKKDEAALRKLYGKDD